MSKVTTTAFITLCWKRARTDLSAVMACALLAAGAPALLHAENRAPEVAQMTLERGDEGVLLSVNLKFDLPSAVEDALNKGVAMIFVAEAEIYRERWYWLDKRVSSAERHIRLVFQPLTRRWRLALASDAIGHSDLGVALAQHYDSLEDAMAVVRRLSGWRIAKLAEIEPGAKHRVEFRFRLDASQLPRPLQIGTLGQSDWSLTTVATRPLELETLK